jgi:multidrug efflux pump
MRRTLGTAVFGGMLGVTLFGIFLTPVFYYVIQWLNDLRSGSALVGTNGYPDVQPPPVTPSAGIIPSDGRGSHP